jgi:hypothetical protein
VAAALSEAVRLGSDAASEVDARPPAATDETVSAASTMAITMTIRVFLNASHPQFVRPYLLVCIGQTRPEHHDQRSEIPKKVRTVTVRMFPHLVGGRRQGMN